MRIITDNLNEVFFSRSFLRRSVVTRPLTRDVVHKKLRERPTTNNSGTFPKSGPEIRNDEKTKAKTVFMRGANAGFVNRN